MSNDLDTQIKKAQLRQINAQTDSIETDSVMKFAQASNVARMGQSLRSGGNPTLGGHTVDNPTENVTNHTYAGGLTVKPTKGRTSCQDAEDRYGELGGLVCGLAQGAEDLWNNGYTPRGSFLMDVLRMMN
jgi:hypothetical protein